MNKAKANKAKCYTSISSDQLNDTIRRKAQELYEKSGRKPGCDLDNWLEAERTVKSQLCGNLQHMPC